MASRRRSGPANERRRGAGMEDGRRGGGADDRMGGRMTGREGLCLKLEVRCVGGGRATASLAWLLFGFVHEHEALFTGSRRCLPPCHIPPHRRYNACYARRLSANGR